MRVLKRRRALISAAALLSQSLSVSAQTTLYWDTNGSASGLGGDSGSWDSGTNWSTSQDGDLDTAGWTDGSIARIQTAGGYAITIAGTISTPQIRIAAANLQTIGGGEIQIPATGMLVHTAGSPNAGGNTKTISSTLSGSGDLTLTAHGDTSASGGGSDTRLALTSPTNTFTGTVTITSGIVSYASNASFGNDSNSIVLNGGGLLDTGSNIPLSRNILVQPAGGLIRTYGSVNTTWTGALTGSGNLRRTDGGTLGLNMDASAFTGKLTNEQGTLRLVTTDWAQTDVVQSDGTNVLRIETAGTTTIKSLVSDRDIVVASGSRLNIANGTWTTVGAGTGFNGFWAQGTVAGTIAATGDLTSSSGTLAITNGVIAEPRVLTATDNRVRLKLVDFNGVTPLSVVKNHDNQLVFDMPNTYTGGTTINGGRIHADNLSSFGTGTVTVNDFGQAWLTQAGPYANNFVLNGLGVPEGAGRLGAIRFANTTLTGNVNVASAARMVAWSSVANLSGTLTGSADLDLNLAGGPGTFNFTGNTAGFTGAMILNAGTLNVGALGGGLTVLGGTANVVGAVPGTTTVAPGATLNLNSGAQTTGIAFTAGGVRTVNINAGATVGGNIITDFAAATAAIVNLGGAVTGNVVIDDGSSLGLRGGNVVGNLTSGFDANSNIAWNHTAPITVSGTVTLNGTQTVTLAANPTPGSPATILNYSGTLGGSASQFQLTNPTSYRNPVITDTGSAIQVSTGSGARTWKGTDATNPTFWDNGSLNWAQGDQRFFNGDAVLFDDSATGTTVAMQGVTMPFSVTFDNSTANFTLTGPGRLSGATGITKNGTGIVTLGGADTQNFTGPIAVNAGTLRMGSRDGFGLTSGVTIASGAVVDINGQTPGTVSTGGYTFNISGDGTGAGALINLGAGQASNAGVRTLNLTGNASIGGTGRFDIGFANTAGFGTINGNGFTLTKRGTNDVSFRGPATGSPINIVVEQGAIWAENNGTAFGGPTGSITVKSGARAGSYGALTINTPATIESGGTLHNQGGGTGTWTEALTFQGGSTIEAGTAITTNGAVSQSGTVAKTGGALLTINGSWALGGGTLNHNAGGIQIGTLGTTGSLAGSGTVNIAAGLLFNNRLAGANHSIGANFTLASATSELRQQAGFATDTLTLTGTVGSSITNGVLRATVGRITLGSGASATVNQVGIQGAPTARSVVNVGAGASLTAQYLNIGQDGGQSGILNVNGGTVTVAAGGNGIRIGHWNNNNAASGSEINVYDGLFDASATNVATNVGWDGFGKMSVGGGTTPATFRTWRLQMDANGDTTAYNATASVLANGVLEIGSGGTASPSVNDMVVLNSGRMIATGNADWGAPIQVAAASEIGAAAGIAASQTGNLSGEGNLTKVGPGAFRFATFGSWTGNLTVAEGTLVGSGNIPGNTTISAGGVLSPGTSHAAGSVGTVTLAGPSTLAGAVVFDLNAANVNPGGTTNDMVSVPAGTNLSFAPGALVRPNFFGGTLASGNRYRLFQVDGTRSGTLPVVDPAIASSVRFTFSVLPGEEPFESDVELVVSGAPGDLVWTGDGAANAWDINSTENWTLNGSPAKFLNYDSVSFTDAGNAAAPVTLTGAIFPTAVTVDSSKDYTWQGTGTIAGSSGLTKSGSGGLTINNANDLNGAIDITGGSVTIGSGGTTGAIAATGAGISLGADSSLAFNRSDAVTFSRGVTGAGTLIKNGAGTLNFNAGGESVLPSNVIVNTGTLQVSSGAFFTGSRLQGGGTLTVNSGATLLLQGSAHALGGTNVNVGGLHLVINGGTMTLNNEQYCQLMTLSGGTVNGTNEIRTHNGVASVFNVTGSAPSTFAARLSLGFGNATWNVEDVTSSPAADATISGQLTGANGIVKNGEGTLALTGPLSASGALTINAGVISIGGNGSRSLPNVLAGSGTLRNDAAGALTLVSASPAFTGVLDTNGRSLAIAGSFGGDGSVIRLAGTPLNAGVGALNFAAVAGDQTADVPVTTTTVNGDFSSLHSTSGNVVPGTTTHVFRGRVFLQGGVQYSFAKNFDDGMWVRVDTTVVINDDTWNNVATGSFTPPATGWYDIDVRAYQGGGGVGPQGDWLAAGIGLGIRQGAPTVVPADYQPFGNGAAGIILAADDLPDTIAAGILLDGGANSTINVSAADLIISGEISSTANEGVIKSGGNTLTLAGVNTYTGNTNVTEGSVVLGATGQLRFRPTTNNNSNKVTGTGSANFIGSFAIDLSSASADAGNSWVLVDVASASYDPSFSVAGFADPENNGTWERNESGMLWSFNEATGILSTTAAAGGYDSWVAAFGLTGAGAERTADPDGDGFSNLQEFLFGASPVAATGSLATMSTEGGNLVLRWLQRETGAGYLLKESAALESWLPSTVTPAADPDQAGAPTDYDRWRAVIPLNQGRRFYRVEGSEN